MIRNNLGILNGSVSLKNLHYKSHEHLHWLLILHRGLQREGGLVLSNILFECSEGPRKVIFRDLSEILKIKNSEPTYTYYDYDKGNQKKITTTIKEAYKYIIDDIVEYIVFEDERKHELKDLLNHILDKKIRKNFIEKSKEYVESSSSKNKTEIIDFLNSYEKEKQLN